MPQVENDELKKIIDKRFEELFKKAAPKYLQQAGFMARKLTDTPTDGFQVVNRQYVTLNGTSANRPLSSIVGQFYLDTTIDKPIWWDGTKFIKADGTTA